MSLAQGCQAYPVTPFNNRYFEFGDGEKTEPCGQWGNLSARPFVKMHFLNLESKHSDVSLACFLVL